MFKISIGELDKRIMIQKDIGEEDHEWKDYKGMWASVNGLYGKEYYAARAAQTESTLDFLIRYSKDFEPLFENGGTVGYRIIWNKRTYDITYADNIKFENKFIKIKALLSRND